MGIHNQAGGNKNKRSKRQPSSTQRSPTRESIYGLDRVVYVVVCVGVWSNEVEVHVVEEEKEEERPEEERPKEEVPAVAPTPAGERVLEPLARAAMVAGVIGIPLLVATIVAQEKKVKG